MEIVRAPEEVNRAIDSLVDYLLSLTGGFPAQPWVLVGVANGGIALAEEVNNRLKKRTGEALPTGILNVSFHRDDIGSRPITRPKEPTQLPFDIQHAAVALIDDVIHSGRTTRAALEELFEHGRPAFVKLFTLVDRGHRVVPIQPDFTAIQLEMAPDQKLNVVIDPDDPLGNRIWTGKR